MQSTAWYRTLLDAQQTHPGATVFDQVVDDEGTVLLCLHCWGPSGAQRDREWPTLMRPTSDSTNGLLLWFVVGDFDAAWQRAQDLGSPIEEEPNRNNGTGQRAFVVRDPDGYHVVVNDVA